MGVAAITVLPLDLPNSLFYWLCVVAGISTLTSALCIFIVVVTIRRRLAPSGWNLVFLTIMAAGSIYLRSVTVDSLPLGAPFDFYFLAWILLAQISCIVVYGASLARRSRRAEI